MISLPLLTPKTAIFGFINEIENNVYKIANQTLNYTFTKVEKEVP